MLIACRRCNDKKLLCSGCSKPVIKLGMRLISCTNQNCYKYRKSVPETDGGVRDIICLACVTEQQAAKDLQAVENKEQKED